MFLEFLYPLLGGPLVNVLLRVYFDIVQGENVTLSMFLEFYTQYVSLRVYFKIVQEENVKFSMFLEFLYPLEGEPW